MLKWITLNNNRGFLLVQTLVAVGIGSLVIMGITSALSNAFKGQKVLLNRLEKIDLQDGIKLALSSSETCQCNFKGLQIPTTASATMDLQELRSYDSTCGTSKTLAQAGELLEGSQTRLKVEKIELSEGFQIGTDRYSFSLNVQLSDPGGLPLSPLEIKNLSFATQNAGGGTAEVTDCAIATPSQQGLGAVEENQCYRVTCTSLNGNTNTLNGSGAGGGIITGMAPSGMGMWVIRVSGGAVDMAVNCWADQVRQRGEQISGQDLCSYYGILKGRNCSLYGRCSYKQGRANPFSSCTYEEC